KLPEDQSNEKIEYEQRDQKRPGHSAGEERTEGFNRPAIGTDASGRSRNQLALFQLVVFVLRPIRITAGTIESLGRGNGSVRLESQPFHEAGRHPLARCGFPNEICGTQGSGLSQTLELFRRDWAEC